MSTPRPATDEHFAEFVRANTAALLATGYLLTRDGGEAEELVQDTLVWLYPRWPQVVAAEHQLAYVRKAVVNRFLAGRRRRSATEVRIDPADPLAERPQQRDETDEVDERMAIWTELAELPDRQRAALVLRFFHDLPDAEVADVLDCRVGTVRSLISRSLAALRARGTFSDDGIGSSYLRDVSNE
ncbi:MAG TPA: SigE family RNA polymerase sigma factor [Jatrophihabitans sp.]|nr:SigE family RNA polymerase sigma factor [Jatrophihabitans sp.]